MDDSQKNKDVITVTCTDALQIFTQI